MSIQTRNWDIRFDNTPGAEGLRISGLVSVVGGAFDATLTQVSDQASSELHLEVALPLWCESAPEPLIDKPVSFFVPGPMKYNTVSIYHEGDMILVITDFLMQPKP
ncbi:hypothetical protein PS3A_27610 [Pseudomonas sp. 3A(2025)]